MSAKRTPHPFAFDEQKDARPLWLRLLALFVVVLLLAWSGSYVYRAWWVSHLTSDLGQFTDAQLRQRLAAVAELGEPGIDALVEQLVHGTPSIAALAFETLSESQAQWSVRWPSGSDSRHFRLVSALERERSLLDNERRAWAQRLCDQVLMDTLSSHSSKGKTAYATSVRLLASLQMDRERRSPQAATLATAIANSPPAEPFNPPIDTAGEQPEADDKLLAPTTIEPQPNASSELVDKPISTPTPTPAEFVAPQSVERLQPVAAVTEMSSNTVLQFTTPGVAPLPVPPTSVPSLAPYETRELIELLLGATPELIAATEDELTARGFNEKDIEVARAIVAANAADRIQLIETLAKQQQVDPRPFLLWLSKDTSRSVRVAAINTLGTMGDPLIRRKLREDLNIETDSTVASHLREAIGLKR